MSSLAAWSASVVRSLRLMLRIVQGLRQMTKPAAVARAGFDPGSGQTPAQYSFFGSCMLRTRLKWRLTAAAFLRLRSEVGFS